ncbi:MAG: hypothetical protein QXO69_00835 [archaeon]
MVAYLAIRTQMKTYLFEMSGEASSISSALGKKSKAFNVFSSKSEALKFAEAHGVPIEFLKICSVSPPTSVMMECPDFRVFGKKKVLPK